MHTKIIKKAPVGTLWKQNYHLTGIEPGLFGRPGSIPVPIPRNY